MAATQLTKIAILIDAYSIGSLLAPLLPPRERIGITDGIEMVSHRDPLNATTSHSNTTSTSLIVTK